MIQNSCAFIAAALLGAASHAFADPVPVNVSNFSRAETDMYMSRFVAKGAFGKFDHTRKPTPIDKQEVIRMNRDTLYSAAVFDLEAAPVTITLPESAKRFLSLQLINEDHYAIDTIYAPSSVTVSREQAGTRYFVALVRTFVNADDPADVLAANAVQDAIKIEQSNIGTFEVPQWDPVTLKKAREALLALFALEGLKGPRFGRREEVEPISWLVSTAAGWGGNPRRDAEYLSFFPKNNDGKSAYTLKVKDVPVDGFWSITMYDAKGFMFENAQKAYSLNNVTAKAAADGTVNIQFGGDPKTASNFMPIAPSWNYIVRLYRPKKEILDGSWKFPDAQPVL
ncbi:MAG: DUF1214 domain-containing protein [Verrucomicrobia bacterium]|nr:DUF1214 domain-containing protein [Verrucomicrobiota bacterium]